jgi:hypothetical protein
MFNPHTEPDARSTSGTRRRSRWLAVGLVSVSLVAVTGCSDDDKDPAVSAASAAGATTTVAGGSPAKGAKASTPSGAKAKAKTPAAIAKEARKAVDRDDYAGAVSIAAALPVAKRKPIGQRATNRLARRAALALKEGNRSAVLSLLAEAKKFPKTKLLSKVRADYLAAEKAFQKRGNDRLADRKDKLRTERAQREANRARARALKAARG